MDGHFCSLGAQFEKYWDIILRYVVYRRGSWGLRRTRVFGFRVLSLLSGLIRNPRKDKLQPPFLATHIPWKGVLKPILLKMRYMFFLPGPVKTHRPSRIMITWYKGIQMLSIHSSCNRGSSSFRFRSKIAWNGGGEPCFITPETLRVLCQTLCHNDPIFTNWTLHKSQSTFTRTFFSFICDEK